MRKLIYAFLALSMLVGSQALASKARLTALGQSTGGSFYLDDARNIFKNPAKLNKFSNNVNLEFGTSARAGLFGEGGFARDFGGYNLAVQLGRESNTESAIKDVINDLTPFDTTPGTTDFETPNNSAEVIGSFKSGDMDVGISVIFGFSDDKAAENAFPNREAGALTIRGGVAKDKWDAYAYYDVISNAKTETAASTESEYESDAIAGIGGTFKTSKTDSVYGKLDYGALTAKDATPTADYEVKAMEIELGYAKKHMMENNAWLFYSAGVSYIDGEVKEKVGDTKADVGNTYIPIVIGMEGKVNDWLELRGSVSQRLLLDNVEGPTDDKSSHPTNTTVVSGGASLHFGKFRIDGVLAGTGAAGSAAFNANTLFVNTSMHYMF